MTKFSLTAYIPYFIYLLALNIFFIRHLGRQTKGHQIVTLSLGFIYLACLGYLCFTPPLQVDLSGFGKMKPFYLGPVPMNPIPFRGIGLDFFLNILLTVPLGLLAPLMRPFKFKKIVLLGVTTGFLIEACQFALDWTFNLNRWVDINDILMNALGVCLGWGLAATFSRWAWFQKFKLNR